MACSKMDCGLLRLFGVNFITTQLFMSFFLVFLTEGAPSACLMEHPSSCNLHK